MRAHRLLPLLVAATACFADAGQPNDPEPIDTARPGGWVGDVDPFIGTANGDAPDPVKKGASGATFPGAASPFGLVQWSPDTPGAAPPGYAYEDSSITGFSLTHLNGAGCPSLRDFPVLPVVGEVVPKSDPRVGFSHANEKAWPGFYEVALDSGVTVDLTATTRTGLARFTFPQDSDAKVLIGGGPVWDALTVSGFELHVQGDDTVVGFRDSNFCFGADAARLFLFAKFDRPFSKAAAWDKSTNNELSDGVTDVFGFPGGLALSFDTSVRRMVHMRVGLSYTSIDAARVNLETEQRAGTEFGAIRSRTEEAWEDLLGRLSVTGGTANDKTSLATALYHVFLQPATVSDVDGKYMGFDDVVHEDPGHTRYAHFSGWDIYRSWIQLVSVLAPDVTTDIIRSLVASGRECGALPQWAFANTETSVMVGDPSDVIIASAHALGIRGFDTDEALQLMRKGAEDPEARCGARKARAGLADYLEVGFCPGDSSRPALGLWGPPSTTMEYAIADASIAQFAKALGKPDLAATYNARARWWRNTWDPNREGLGFKGFPQLRNKADDADGKPAFRATEPGSPDGFIEGNPAQYAFLAPQDPFGLVEAMGGEAEMTRRLDALMSEVNAGLSRPHFYIGNEPNFATPWLYPWTGAPSHMQESVRRVVRETFQPVPSGLPGNDDLGATSSWLAWSLIGMYPAVPGVGGFVLSTPAFDEVTLRIAQGALVLSAAGAGDDAIYTSGIRLGDRPLSRAWVDWSEISGGGRLTWTRSETPDDAWATTRPPDPLEP